MKRNKQNSFWVLSQGFTKNHVVSISICFMLFGAISIAMALNAIDAEGDARLELLLGAIFLAVFTCVILLSSILSLMFYTGLKSDEQLNNKSDNNDDIRCFKCEDDKSSFIKINGKLICENCKNKSVQEIKENVNLIS